MIENISTGMVREHWYKGRVVGTKKYVEGSLIVSKTGECYIGVYVEPETDSIEVAGRSNGKTNRRFQSIGFYQVSASSVAEFTGIYDIHKKKIFEFDRIRHYNRRHDDPTAYEEGFVFWDKEKLQWCRTRDVGRRRGDNDQYCRIWQHDPSEYEVIENENT